jgi:hypothetical protein
MLVLYVDKYSKFWKESTIDRLDINKHLELVEFPGDSAPRTVEYELVSFDKNPSDNHVYAIVKDPTGRWTKYNDYYRPEVLSEESALSGDCEVFVYCRARHEPSDATSLADSTRCDFVSWSPPRGDFLHHSVVGQLISSNVIHAFDTRQSI